MFLVATGILIALGTFTRGGGNGGTVGGANTKVPAAAGSGESSATVTIVAQLHVIRVGAANLTVTSSGTTQNNSAQQVANASSLTVVTTACQSELMTWFVSNAQLRYELESFHDYAPAVSGPDATCPSVTKASGITAADIVKKFPSFAQAYGG